MGYSWSSFVVQPILLGVCRDAGLTADIALTLDQPAPINTSLCVGLATDDVMIFDTSVPRASNTRGSLYMRACLIIVLKNIV